LNRGTPRVQIANTAAMYSSGNNHFTFMMGSSNTPAREQASLKAIEPAI